MGRLFAGLAAVWSKLSFTARSAVVLLAVFAFFAFSSLPAYEKYKAENGQSRAGNPQAQSVEKRK